MTETPCHNDDRFISDDADVMREAAALCFDCPVFELCWDSGKGEPAGVIAGTVPSDLERKAAIAAGRKKDVCRNGHDWGTYGENLDGLEAVKSNAPHASCARCATIRRHMFSADPSQPVPDTPPVDRQPIRHGTEAGYAAHLRFGVPLCDGCRIARSLARMFREEAS